MNRLISLSALAVAALIATVPAAAQPRWIVSYQGTETRSVSNRLVTTQVTDRTFIQRCAANAGISTENLALVLHFDAEAVGDSLEVVNVNDPNLFRCQVFRLAFPESQTNSAGGLKRFGYVYDATSDHSRGSALITRTEVPARKGKPAVTTIQAQLHYWLGIWDESQPDPNAVVASGVIKSKAPLNP